MEKDIEAELSAKGKLTDPEEDIHSVVERRLHDHIGDAALRLHTGRSRNDQSATDTRLWMLQAFPRLKNILLEVILVNTYLYDSRRTDIKSSSASLGTLGVWQPVPF